MELSVKEWKKTMQAENKLMPDNEKFTIVFENPDADGAIQTLEGDFIKENDCEYVPTSERSKMTLKEWKRMMIKKKAEKLQSSNKKEMANETDNLSQGVINIVFPEEEIKNDSQKDPERDDKLIQLDGNAKLAPNLPSETILPIFHFLDDFFDRRATSLVSHLWNQTWEDSSLWESVLFSPPLKIKKNTEQLIAQHIQPRHLVNIDNFSLTENHFFTGRAFARLAGKAHTAYGALRITVLDFTNCVSLEETHLCASLRLMPNLEELSLHGIDNLLNDPSLIAIINALSNERTDTLLKVLRLGTATPLRARPANRIMGVCLATIQEKCPRLRNLSIRFQDLLYGDRLIELVHNNTPPVPPSTQGPEEAQIQFGAEMAELDLQACAKVCSASLMFLQTLPNLLNLNLKNCWLIDNDGADLIGLFCPRLKILNISGCEFINGVGLDSLSERLEELEELSMARLNKLRDEDISLLLQRRSKSLKHISLALCDNITTISGVQLCLECRLTGLNLADCKQVNAAEMLRCVSEQSDREQPLSSLTMLNLKNCGGMNDDAIETLLDASKCAAQSLERLYFGGSKIHSYAIEGARFGEYNSTSDKVGHQVSDKSMFLIARVLKGKLDSFDCEFCPEVSTEGLLQVLKSAPQLRKLGVRSLARITDDVVIYLQNNLPRLQELDISNTPCISRSCLKGFQRSKHHLMKRLIFETRMSLTFPHL